MPPSPTIEYNHDIVDCSYLIDTDQSFIVQYFDPLIDFEQEKGIYGTSDDIPDEEIDAWMSEQTS